MDKPNQLNNPISGRVIAGKRLAQRQRLMRAISQTYRQKAGKRNSIHRRVTRAKYSEWNVEHKKLS